MKPSFTGQRSSFLPSTSLLLASLLFASSLAACIPTSTVPPTPSAAVPLKDPPQPTFTYSPFSTADDAVVLSAVNDLSRRLGVEAANIQVLSVEKTDFTPETFACDPASPDLPGQDLAGSGTPQSPSGTPALTIPGRTILLSVGDQKYEYHATASEAHFCRSLNND
jgi:hypothetical protein